MHSRLVASHYVHRNVAAQIETRWLDAVRGKAPAEKTKKEFEERRPPMEIGCIPVQDTFVSQALADNNPERCFNYALASSLIIAV